MVIQWEDKKEITKDLSILFLDKKKPFPLWSCFKDEF